ncbi:glycosyltransferase family 8 protein, partial [Streptomyces klenkii]|uniref:glycosyltransferase family 8 protein n=1 Tax=Streptomyces klenkii TaxID=1420899 RepID=UPI0033BAA153
DDYRDLRLIVLHDRLPSDARAAVLSHGRRIGLSTELRPVFQPMGRPVPGHFNEATYLRLSVADVLVDEPIVLYLDADIYVRRSLRPLLCLELNGAPLGAVRDAGNPVLEKGAGLPGWDSLGLPGGREYFNSGVLLLDLPACRARRLFERARGFLADHSGNMHFPDQDALNWAADDDWLRLSRTWNTFVDAPRSVLLSEQEKAAVLHFVGQPKPWHLGYPSGRPREMYRQHLHPCC